MNTIKRFFIVLLPMLMVGTQAWAQQRSESEAMAVAADFLQQEKGIATAPRLNMLPRQHLATQIRRQLMRPRSGYALHTGFYVFNAEDGGFVLVGADSRQRDVLAYCTEGSFDATDLPCGLAALLEQYNREYESVQASAEAPSSPAQAPRRIETHAVAPLLKTEWGQGTPYNTYCPMDPKTDKRCLTGCVATAQAQVMYYHRYPSACADSLVTYVSTYDDDRHISLSKRLSSIPLNWSDMLNIYSNVSYTAAEGNAVGNLMYACGLSVHMSYSSDASSSFSSDHAYALINFFGYNPNIKYVKQKYYTDTEWARMIETELTEGRPVLYGGHSEPNDDGNTSGHAFVVDGMDSEARCHVNWGWSGKYQKNGDSYVYFALSSFKPGSSDYSKDHEMVLGTTKDKIGTREIVFYSDGFDIVGWQQGFGVGATTQFQCTTWCYDSHANSYHTPLPCYLAYGIVEAGGDGKLQLLTSLQAEPFRFRISKGWKFNADVTFDASRFKEGGKYLIYPAVINEQKTYWYGIHTKGAASNYYVARVKGGRIYLARMRDPDIPGEVPSINLVSQTCDNSDLTSVKPGERLMLHAVYENNGAAVTTDTRVRIFNADIKGVYHTSGRAYTFATGMQTKVDGSITLPDTIADGSYYATIQFYRSWGDNPTWIYFKEKLIPFTVGDAPREMSVKTSTAGYATFFDSQASFVLPAGLKAYVVTASSGGRLSYSRIADGNDGGIVPKGVAVMLEGGSSKTYTLVSTKASAAYSGSNLLRGSDVQTTTTAPSSTGYLFYQLSYGRSGTAYSNVFGWYWGRSSGAAFTIAGHKAWLALQESTTRASFFTLDNLDGIETLNPIPSTRSHEVYDLSGRKVQRTLPKGIYITNGKKVLEK